MSIKKLSKSSRIMIVEGSGQARSTIIGCVRSLGFDNYVSASTLSDALNVIETEPVDWIITTMQLDGSVNIFQLMNLCLLHKQLNQICVSVFYKEGQLEEVAHLYELGLLSHHPSNYSKASLTLTLETLTKRLDGNQFDVRLTAIDYLKDLLLELKRTNELVETSSRFVSALLGDPKFMLKHASILMAVGKVDDALNILSQILLVSPELKDQVHALKSHFAPEKELQNFSEGSGLNMLNIVNAVVVDPDTASLTAMKKSFELIGARKVEYFSEPKEALEFLKDHKEQTVIIQEWRMAKISGPTFIQKVRQLGHDKTPIIIVSSQVTERDQHLTYEMGVATVVAKPIKQEEFIHALVWTMKQEINPTEIKVLERKIMALLARKKSEEVRMFISNLLAEKKITQSVHDYFLSEIFYHDRNFDAARERCVLALKGGYNSVRIYHLFGKILMKKGDFSTAIKCFEKAQELSPLNIIRICALAEANIEVGNKKEAETLISKAKEIDPTSKDVAIIEANYHITFNDIKAASKVLQGMEGFDEVLSYMNNKGISLALGGKCEEAITYYARAKDALPERAEHLHGFIQYNMSLAYVRLGDLDKAVEALRQCVKSKDKKLLLKSKSLESRIQQSLKDGTTFTLKTKESAVQHSDNALVDEKFIDTSTALTVLTISPGDRCCYKIFQQNHSTNKFANFYSKVPVFKNREAIIRPESMGVEKGIKAG